MIVSIRPESERNQKLLTMLQYQVQQMLYLLWQNHIVLADKSVKIWIKRHTRTGNLYPKIEFDANGQELQYELDEHGTIKEVHFKSFDRKTGCLLRADIAPEDACPLLQQINQIILPNGLPRT